jgi:hypothetical protein
MGTTLTGTTPQDTYDSLIKVTDNGPLSGSLKALSDGLGNDSTLSLSTTAASIAGTLAVTGNATFDTNTLFVDAANDRVGVGLTAPTELLHLSTTLAGSTGVGTAIQITSGGAGGDNGFIGVNKGAGNGLELSVENRDIIFNTGATTPFGGTERMRITAAGNVGIGTSSPATQLHVAGTTLSHIRSEATSTNGEAVLSLLGKNASADVRTFQIKYDNADIVRVGTPNPIPIRFETNDVERLRILSDGGLTFNGDTAQANALDDYEEGTWTIGVEFGGASVGVTADLSGGTYTKIGRQVTVNGFLRLTNKGSSTGSATLTGLPFTIANNNANFSAASLRLNNITFANQFQGVGNTNSTAIVLQEITEAGVLDDITNADFANNSSIMLSFTYFV